jgi:predicted kinase
MRPKLIVCCGIPGSGKTYYSKEYIEKNPNTVHLSSDSIRAELYGDESIQGDPNEVFTLMQKRAVEALNNGQNVVYDATSITRKDRVGIIAACPKFAKIECHVIFAPIETCIERDAARKRTVGKVVIDKMLKRFQAPWYDEGFNEIKIIRPDKFNYIQYMTDVFEAMKIPHDNPHHTLDIYKHCEAAQDYVCASNKDDTGLIAIAAMVHDAGKPYCKAFVDSHGNTCETAHFYQHQCISAWLAYGIYGDAAPIDIAWLVSTHMEPFFNSKYYNKLPAYLKKQVDLLHEADKAAH